MSLVHISQLNIQLVVDITTHDIKTMARVIIAGKSQVIKNAVEVLTTYIQEDFEYANLKFGFEFLVDGEPWDMLGGMCDEIGWYLPPTLSILTGEISGTTTFGIESTEVLVEWENDTAKIIFVNRDNNDKARSKTVNLNMLNTRLFGVWQQVDDWARLIHTTIEGGFFTFEQARSIRAIHTAFENGEANAHHRWQTYLNQSTGRHKAHVNLWMDTKNLRKELHPYLELAQNILEAR